MDAKMIDSIKINEQNRGGFESHEASDLVIERRHRACARHQNLFIHTEMVVTYPDPNVRKHYRL